MRNTTRQFNHYLFNQTTFGRKNNTFLCFSGFLALAKKRKHLQISTLQIPSLKIRPLLQTCPPQLGERRRKNRSPTEIILHFFSRFLGFLRFLPLQAIAFQRQAATQPLQKKSCLKTDGRFSLRPGLCHDRRMNVERTGRNEGCGGRTVLKRRPALPAPRFGARNDSSAFGRLAGNWRRRAHFKTCRPFGCQSHPITHVLPADAGHPSLPYSDARHSCAKPGLGHAPSRVLALVAACRAPAPEGFRGCIPCVLLRQKLKSLCDPWCIPKRRQ